MQLAGAVLLGGAPGEAAEPGAGAARAATGSPGDTLAVLARAPLLSWFLGDLVTGHIPKANVPQSHPRPP